MRIDLQKKMNRRPTTKVEHFLKFSLVLFYVQAGPRICLGKEFAYRQMKIVSIALLRFFRFKLADETKNVTYRTMFTLHIHGGLHICAISRAGS
jgi:cytochrome P450